MIGMRDISITRNQRLFDSRSKAAKLPRRERRLSETNTLLKAPHAAEALQVSEILHTDMKVGLSSVEAARRLARYGRNELAKAPPEPWWRRLARQFADLLIWILIAAAIISGALGEWLDAISIQAIVALNGILGFVQEGRAEQALLALRKLSSPHAKAVRDGRSQNVPAEQLVPGDRIDLEPGDRVP